MRNDQKVIEGQEDNPTPESVLDSVRNTAAEVLEDEGDVEAIVDAFDSAIKIPIDLVEQMDGPLLKRLGAKFVDGLRVDPNA